MSKTWYGHHIENIKGEDYVLFKDYLELDKEIERLNNIINELEKYIKESCWKDSWGVDTIYVNALLNKLQELKGDSSNE